MTLADAVAPEFDIPAIESFDSLNPANGEVVAAWPVHSAEDDAIVVYSKHLPGRFTRSGRDDTVIVVANVDPHSARETTVHLDLAALGLEPGTEFDVRDVVTGARWTWGSSNYVRLDAFQEPVHLLVVEGPHR